ncbi:MAG: hypothetical protein ACPG4T_03845 [Nannocystaceae bacterium]
MHSTTNACTYMGLGLVALLVACGPGSNEDPETGQPTGSTTEATAETKAPTACISTLAENDVLADGPLDDLDIPRSATLCQDTAHEFGFTLTHANYFIAETRFDRQLGNLRLSVLDANMKTLWTSVGGELAVIHRLLPAGHYMLRIEGLEGDLAYALRVRALPTSG